MFCNHDISVSFIDRIVNSFIKGLVILKVRDLYFLVKRIETLRPIAPIGNCKLEYTHRSHCANLHVTPSLPANKKLFEVSLVNVGHLGRSKLSDFELLLRVLLSFKVIFVEIHEH